ncbi:MAG: M81 family metallopeptidase [Geminicoccaceae bacterium]|nr:M81 family metallopeptidase [Geminicoccaceae bacterium]
MRIFAASLATETNTFAPIPTSMASFREAFYAPPSAHPERPSLCSAPLIVARRRAREEGWTLIEGTSAWAEPAGICARETYETLRDEILGQLEAAMPLDGVLLGLHGAMVAHGYEDCEGDLITAVRAIVGEKAVIGVEHDPHCHLTARRLESCDVLVTFKEFPHTDNVDRAEEVVDLTLRTIAGTVRPRMSVVDGRTISSFPTTRPPMRGFVDRIKALEGKDEVLSISIAHGFPYGDVPEMGLRVLVITDDRKEQGDRLAMELAREITGFRAEGPPPYLTLDEALDRIAASGSNGTTVIADPSDNPGGGAPGDSTHVLRRLIERGVESAAFGPLWDPVAVSLCHAAGPGAVLPLRFGGKTAPASGPPIDAEVEVAALATDAHQSFAGGLVPLGDCALIRTGGIEVVLIEKRTQALGLELFGNLGVDLGARRIVCLKSTNHFHAAFAPIADEVLYVDSEGPLPRDHRRVPYRNVRRPIWPLDEVSDLVRII